MAAADERRDDELFPMLDPPAGGLARLRARLDAPQRARQGLLGLPAWGVPALGLAVAAVVLVARLRAPPAEPIVLDAGVLVALDRGIVPPQARATTASAEPVRLADGSLLYRVGSVVGR